MTVIPLRAIAYPILIFTGICSEILDCDSKRRVCRLWGFANQSSLNVGKTSSICAESGLDRGSVERSAIGSTTPLVEKIDKNI